MDTGFWKPSSVRAIMSTRPGRQRSAAGHSPAVRLHAASDWLARAQDVTGDGGISWGYRLRSGWRRSYPETTGYIVSTFLHLAEDPTRSAFRQRASRAIDFLAGAQLESGAFPGGIVADTGAAPSVFNTGQIINGMTSWYRASGDDAVLALARSAADWLCSVQDDDGAWRRHGYMDYPVTYTAHASCWLAELGILLDENRYTSAAGAHLDWVLRQRDPATGWFDLTGFNAADHRSRRSLTHTLAYTLWGVTHSGVVLGRPDAVAAARTAAMHVANLVAAEGWLPGVIDASWRPQSRYACLTGNAQMALVWMRHAALDPDARLSRAAATAIDRVGAAQSIGDDHPGIRGGIPGSDPITAAYIPSALPNWAAKFYIDALLAAGRSTLGFPDGDRNEAAPAGEPE